MFVLASSSTCIIIIYGYNIYSCASVPTQYATNKMLLNKELYKNHYVNSSNIYHFITTEMCNILQKSKLKYVKPNAAWYM